MVFNLLGKLIILKKSREKKKTRRKRTDEERRYDYFIVVESCRNGPKTVYEPILVAPPPTALMRWK